MGLARRANRHRKSEQSRATRPTGGVTSATTRFRSTAQPVERLSHQDRASSSTPRRLGARRTVRVSAQVGTRTWSRCAGQRECSNSGMSEPTSAYWENPETWPPPGLGCSWCHIGRPIVWTMAWPGGGGICEHCLLARFGEGFGRERIFDWLIGQAELHARQEERRLAIAAWRRGELDLVDQYREKYGVNLVAA